MRIDTDINLADIVYIDHKQYEVIGVNTSTKFDSYWDTQTIVEFRLDYMDDKRRSPNVFPMEYSRIDFLSKLEYRDSLIVLANSLKE